MPPLPADQVEAVRAQVVAAVLAGRQRRAGRRRERGAHPLVAAVPGLTEARATAPRVDPFLLPAATTARFVLLVVLTLFGSTFAADWYFGGPDGWGNGFDLCIASFDLLDPAGTPPRVVTEAFMNCVQDVNRRRFAVAGGRSCWWPRRRCYCTRWLRPRSSAAVGWSRRRPTSTRPPSRRSGRWPPRLGCAGSRSC